LIRKSDNDIFFDSSLGDLIFSKYYMEISTKVATKHIWGFGERYSSNFNLQIGKYTIWNKDKGERIDHQQGYQTYGHYPAYLARANSGDWYVTHLRNSNAMDVIVDNDNTTSFKMTYKVIGGIFDFRFILGSENPEVTI
jgi:alpha-glucosidase (family GH31 glycosyl hydrolase)